MSKPALWRLITVLSCAVAAVATAEAETSAPATPAAVATHALAAPTDTIAFVTVTAVSSLINRAMSSAGLMSVEAYSYQLEVQRQWKGEAVDQAVMTVAVQQCSRPLIRGERYLIFGQRAQHGHAAIDITDLGRVESLAQPAQDRVPRPWLITRCEHAIPAGQAQAHVVQLDQLYRSPVAHHQP